MEISLRNYTAKARSYTLLANWPQREGAVMVDNEHGGRAEMTGVWAWKLETLKPGESATITFALDGLEKGDWTETDVFYRGAGDVIGASKMDDALLAELRRQEDIITGEPQEEEEEAMADEPEGPEVPAEDSPAPPVDEGGGTPAPSGPKQTLFDYTEGEA